MVGFPANRIHSDNHLELTYCLSYESQRYLIPKEHWSLKSKGLGSSPGLTHFHLDGKFTPRMIYLQSVCLFKSNYETPFTTYISLVQIHICLQKHL